MTILTLVCHLFSLPAFKWNHIPCLNSSCLDRLVYQAEWAWTWRQFLLKYPICLTWLWRMYFPDRAWAPLLTSSAAADFPLALAIIRVACSVLHESGETLWTRASQLCFAFMTLSLRPQFPHYQSLLPLSLTYSHTLFQGTSNICMRVLQVTFPCFHIVVSILSQCSQLAFSSSNMCNRSVRIGLCTSEDGFLPPCYLHAHETFIK